MATDIAFAVGVLALLGKRVPPALRVLLLAPTARDGQVSCQLLAAVGIRCEVCRDLEHLLAEMAEGAALLVLPEEVVLADAAATLQQAVRRQPAWSDLPVLVLARTGTQSPAVERAVGASYASAVAGGGRRVTTRSLRRFRLPRIPIRRDMPVSLAPLLRGAVWLEEWMADAVRRYWPARTRSEIRQLRKDTVVS